MRIWAAMAFTVACLAGTTQARADQRLGVDVGAFSAVGEAGLTYSAAYLPEFRVELGLGTGFTGYQLSAMPKLALGSLSDHYLGGAGVSVSLPRNGEYERVVWLNVDALGYEHRFTSGWSLQFSLGVTIALTDVSPGGELPVRSGFWVPQARFGVGHWF